MTINQLLKEEIYGNTATVYHRCNKDKLKLIIERIYQNQAHIHFNNYNQALYTTYNIKSQLGKSDIQKFGDMSHYGDYVIKFAVKGLQNFFFTSEKEYKKFHPNFKGTDFIEQQLKDAGAGARVLKDFNNISNKKNHVTIGHFLEKEGYIPSRFKGLQYNGEHDGDCLLIFDYTSVIPLSITNDNGKTWIKIQNFIKDQNIQKIDDFKKNKFKNFQKNDLVNKTKQSRKLASFHIDGKDLNIDYDIENAAEFKKYNLQYKNFNNLIINPQAKKIYLSNMNFKKATIDNVDFVFKKCNFDTFILGKINANNNLIDGEIETLEYKLNTIDSLYYFLDNNYTTLKVRNLAINAKCFDFQAQASELEDDDGFTTDKYAAGDFSDLFRIIKLQKIVIDGDKLNKKVFEKCLRGTKIKAYYNSKILEVRDGKLIEKDDVAYLMVDEKIFNY